MNQKDIARKMLADRKGMLAFDQSAEELDAEFAREGILAGEEMRRAYRELLFTTEGIEEFLSGVTLSSEALADSSPATGAFHDYLSAKNILIGIEVEKNISGSAEEMLKTMPAFLSGLKSSSLAYAEWHAMTDIADGPSHDALKEDIRRRVEFAKICQSIGIVPVIEFEHDMNGPHSAAQAEDHLTETLALISDALESGSVDLKTLVIKTSMAVTGTENPLRAEPKEVAERTVRALSASLPETLGGVVFLSGAQKPEEAAANLNWIARFEPLPWPIAFSFSHALLSPALSLWKGRNENRAEAQSAFIERLSLAQLADVGGYGQGAEESALG